MAQKLEYPADIAQDWEQYAALNPAFGPDSADPRAAEDLALLKQDPSALEPAKQRELIRQVRLLQFAIRAKISQLIDNPEWMRRGGASEADFCAAERTELKTFQEVLAHPAERMVFARNEPAADPASGESAIPHIVIDPRRLSDALLRNLGLDRFAGRAEGKRRSEEQKLERRTEAIPAIREILRRLEPVRLPSQEHGMKRLRYFRLLRIARGRHCGMVLGTENVNGEKILFLTDLYGEHRRLLYIERGYTEEIAKLKLIQSVLETVRERLNEWSDIRHSGELDELTRQLLECVDSLRYVQDANKVRLRDRVVKCLQFRDSKGRFNPAGAQAALTGALNDIGARLQDIEGIWSYIGKDKAKVAQMLEEEKIPAERFLADAEAMHGRFRILRQSPPMNDGEKRLVAGNLRALRSQMSRLKFDPFMTFGKKCGEQTDKVIALLEGEAEPPEGEDLQQTAAKEFTKIYLLAKVLRCYTELQDFYTRISLNPHDADPARLLNEVQQMHGRLSRRTMAQSIRTPEYDALYGKIYNLLNRIKKILQECVEMRQSAAKPSVQDKSAEPPPFRHTPRPAPATSLDVIIERLSRLPLLGRAMQRLKKRLDALKSAVWRAAEAAGFQEASRPAGAEGSVEECPDRADQTEESPAETAIHPDITAVIQEIKEQIREFSFPALLYGSLP